MAGIQSEEKDAEQQVQIVGGIPLDVERQQQIEQNNGQTQTDGATSSRGRRLPHRRRPYSPSGLFAREPHSASYRDVLSEQRSSRHPAPERLFSVVSVSVSDVSSMESTRHGEPLGTSPVVGRSRHAPVFSSSSRAVTGSYLLPPPPPPPRSTRVTSV